ncbi:hypothetical protein [Hyphococcus sp. DH-69]|uniref:hypothetical protein n=1 Tax=Hyphococcus formosus TaxID=3143534 RepID=UPI00398B5211
MRDAAWLNTGLGVAAFALTVFSTLALLTDKPYFSNEIAIGGALAFGILIIIIAALYRPKHSLTEIKADRLMPFAEKAGARAEEIVIVNPQKSGDLIPWIIRDAVEKNVPVSVLGDAKLVHNLLSHVIHEMEGDLYQSTRILSAPSEECIVCYLNKGTSGIQALLMAREFNYLFRIRDSFVASLVLEILKKEKSLGEGSIGLTNVANPTKLISVVQEEQEKYLQNFQSLQKGYISFYGTEVQSVQSGWVESGDFKSIDTLDMTTNPKRLLERHRYNAANERFIKNGGRIRRVYMVRADDFANEEFLAPLRELYKQQINIGVEIGLLMLDDLPQRLRKDFILYDDAIVLVEDQQASADYKLGRSTAYFSSEAITQHRRDFDSVWQGQVTGRLPADTARELLGTA